MDTLTFLSKLIESLAWPAVVIIALFIFRHSLVELIGSLKYASIRWKKGDISLRLETIRERVATKVPEKALPKEIERLAQTSPEDAIEQSWRALESTAISTVARTEPVSPLQLANILLEKKVLDENEADAFYQLYGIRNDALHPATRVVTDVSSAHTFSSIASSLADEIKKKGS